MLKTPVLLSLFDRADSSVGRKQIKTADSDKCIDNAGKPAHITKQKCHQVKSEESDESPVDGSNDYKC